MAFQKRELGVLAGGRYLPAIRNSHSGTGLPCYNRRTGSCALSQLWSSSF